MRPCLPFPGKSRSLLTLFLLSGLSAGTASAAPETLVLRNPAKETLFVHIDYARAPDIAPFVKPWKDLQVDSFYVTDSGTASEASHLRYTRAFYVELDGRKGAGTDYIYYDHIKGEEPHYTANIGFFFQEGDTTEAWTSSEGHHLNDDPRVWAYEDGIHDSTEMNFTVVRQAGGPLLPGPEGFIDFLARRQDWIGSVPVSSLTRESGFGPGQTGPGWVIWGNSSALTVPAHATRLDLLDAMGRTVWKGEALVPGARLALPTGIRPGAFRCVWRP
jgi:hypothetical protein